VLRLLRELIGVVRDDGIDLQLKQVMRHLGPDTGESTGGARTKRPRADPQAGVVRPTNEVRMSLEHVLSGPQPVREGRYFVQPMPVAPSIDGSWKLCRMTGDCPEWGRSRPLR
jgi:hypothetical protein